MIRGTLEVAGVVNAVEAVRVDDLVEVRDPLAVHASLDGVDRQTVSCHG